MKMRRWDTDPHYWKNPALRRSREKGRFLLCLVLGCHGSAVFCSILQGPEDSSQDANRVSCEFVQDSCYLSELLALATKLLQGTRKYHI